VSGEDKARKVYVRRKGPSILNEFPIKLQITAKDEIVKGDVPLMRHLLARQDNQS
jgi:hypothetical protein